MGVGHQTRVLKTETVHVTRGGGGNVHVLVYFCHGHIPRLRETCGQQAGISQSHDILMRVPSLLSYFGRAAMCACLLQSRLPVFFSFYCLLPARYKWRGLTGKVASQTSGYPEGFQINAGVY